jgi:hypothetical protein
MSPNPSEAEPIIQNCTGPCGRDLPWTEEFFHRKGERFASRCRRCTAETRTRTENPETRRTYKQALYLLRERHTEEFESILDDLRRHDEAPNG